MRPAPPQPRSPALDCVLAEIVVAGTETKACALVAARHPALRVHGWDVVGAEEAHYGLEEAYIVDCFEGLDPLSFPTKATVVLG